MIRFALRQSRNHTLVAAGALVAIAVLVVITRFHITHVYDASVVGCRARGTCPNAVESFLQIDATIRTWLGIVVVAVPGIIGVFWGAPLVARELETGTYRLAWTQSVTRSRWLGARLGVLGATTVVAVGLLTLLVVWWASLFDRVGQNLYSTFDQRGVVPVGHALFAFVLGVTVGLILRRTLPAMATTFLAFVAIRLAVVNWIRPNLFAAVKKTYSLTHIPVGIGSRDGGPTTLMADPPPRANAWMRGVDVVDSTGRSITPQRFAAMCPDLAGPPRPMAQSNKLRGPAPEEARDAFTSCVAKLSRTYHAVVSYQPPSRYWPLQWFELGIYVSGAALLAVVCWWWIRRRLR
jgi:ABC-type transport system involved in multi-copper enzyme maturation permease subunit